MDIKLVIQVKGDRATIGAQGANTDPVMESIALTNPDRALSEAIESAVDLVARAQQRWEANPKNPAYERPTPPPTPAPAAARPAAPARGRASAQESMF